MTSVRARFLGALLMVMLSAVNYLRQLAVIDPADAQGVQYALAGLVNSLQITVSSYHGLHLTIVDQGHPVSLIEFSEDHPESMTSLRVDLAAMVLDADPASRLVLYAGVEGAFVDLAADLRHTLKVSHRTRRTQTDANPVDHGFNQSIKLDRDLPPTSTVSGLVGLADLSRINRAVGLLIGRGLLSDAAHETLHRGAAARGVQLHEFAVSLLLTR